MKAMAGIHVVLIDAESARANGVMHTISMVYADMHWEEFRAFWQMPEEDSEEMRKEFRYFLIRAIHENPDSLSAMLTVLGKEKTEEYINELCKGEE